MTADDVQAYVAQHLESGARAPLSLSKSTDKSTGCERYFALRYLSRAPRTTSEAARVGSDFHKYRAAYTTHLRDTGQRRDPEWVDALLREGSWDPDVASLITEDRDRYSINPDALFATELYLSVGWGFEPLESEENSIRHQPRHAETRFDGLLDRLEVADSHAIISDPKTSWTDKNVSPYEPVHYAGLVFAHFPYVQTVEFSWDFVRARATAPKRFERRFDLRWIQDQMRRAYIHMAEIVKRIESGEEAAVDPTAGLCHWCPYSCPLRDAVTAGLLDTPPLQTSADIAEFGRRVYMAGEYYRHGRELLTKAMETHDAVDLGHGLIMDIAAAPQASYPLDRVLKVLGVEAEPVSPKWEVPLRALVVGATGLKSKAKTQMRSGLWEELAAIAESKPHFELRMTRDDNG